MNRLLGSLCIGAVLSIVVSSVSALPVNIPAIVPNLERATVLTPATDLAQPVMEDTRMDPIGLEIFAPRSSQARPSQARPSHWLNECSGVANGLIIFIQFDDFEMTTHLERG